MQPIALPTQYDLTIDDLRRLTNQMIDTMLDIIKDCVDADVIYEPEDPNAYDSAASDPSEVYMSWRLGHLIVHVTASSEEAAALAAELARGVAWHGRSRSEVPWREVTTIEECRHRLEESRRMRLASLDMWPDHPYLQNTYAVRDGAEPINCVRRFINGLRHDQNHLDQMVEVVRQAKQART